MKIKSMTMLFTLFMVAAVAFSLWQLGDVSYQAVDTVILNDQYQHVLKGLAEGAVPEELEKAYYCTIVPIEDASYEQIIMKAASQGKVVLDYFNETNLAGKVIFSGNASYYQGIQGQLKRGVLLSAAAILLLGYLILLYVYRGYVRPFGKLEQFASGVARGNLDIPLSMTRHNYFGAFTESFDLMREELKQARKNEYQANISKKELVASLSHDVKTPIATIKATCEVMMLQEKDSCQRNKIGIIAAKADMVDQLVGNMFQATMEELEMLKVTVQEVGTEVIPRMIQELTYYGDIQLDNEIPSCLIYADPLRLNQVIDNIINNSYKYAKTGIRIAFGEQDTTLQITIRDEGPGVKEEDLPLLMEKYYRGSNAGDQEGTGLGLYLAKFFMEHMGGRLECFNQKGFVVLLYLNKV